MIKKSIENTFQAAVVYLINKNTLIQQVILGQWILE